ADLPFAQSAHGFLPSAFRSYTTTPRHPPLVPFLIPPRKRGAAQAKRILNRRCTQINRDERGCSESRAEGAQYPPICVHLRLNLLSSLRLKASRSWPGGRVSAISRYLTRAFDMVR